MGSQKLILILIFQIYNSNAQNSLQQQVFPFKRPIFGNNDHMISYSENQSEQSSQPNIRQSIFSRNNPYFSASNGFGVNPGGAPIGSSYSPNFMPNIQNGYGYGSHSSINPYQQFQNAFNPYFFQNHLMPFMNNNFANSFRGGMPAYGFGYGLIGTLPNHSFLNTPNRETITNNNDINNKKSSRNYKLIEEPNLS